MGGARAETLRCRPATQAECLFHSTRVKVPLRGLPVAAPASFLPKLPSPSLQARAHTHPKTRTRPTGSGKRRIFLKPSITSSFSPPPPRAAKESGRRGRGGESRRRKWAAFQRRRGAGGGGQAAGGAAPHLRGRARRGPGCGEPDAPSLAGCRVAAVPSVGRATPRWDSAEVRRAGEPSWETRAGNKEGPRCERARLGRGSGAALGPRSPV